MAVELNIDVEKGLKISLDAIAFVIVCLAHKYEIGNENIFLKYIIGRTKGISIEMIPLPDLEGEDMRKWLQARHNKNT